MPLHVACEFGQLDAVIALLVCGADLNSTSLRFQRTPMLFASEGGNVELLPILAAGRANPTLSDIFGNPPLRGAVRRGDCRMVSALIKDCGAPVNQSRDKNNPDSALYSAVDLDRLDVTIALLSSGANVDVVVDPAAFAYTPLHDSVTEL